MAIINRGKVGGKMSRGYGFKNISSVTIKGVYYIIPFAITGGVLISLAYITDMIFSSTAIYGLGSENPVAVILKSIGTLTFSLMLPVLAGVIATEITDKGAFMAGLAGGYLAQTGATLMLPYGDTTAVSGFIGAIFAGVAAGLIYKALKKILSKVKESYKHIAKTILTPFITLFVTSVLILSINPVVGILNTGLSALLMIISEANPVAFGALIGIMTAIDMGGTISKAAFIFATAGIASGEYTAMAAVMSAGMTVSLSIALCSTVFKIKFSKKESELAKANLLFGLLNITEGAIPIVAKNPLRVIPACTIGAAISGALSAGFGCTLIAPFGGLLVIPLVGKPLFFILSVLTGTLIGAVMLGIMKKEPKTNYKEPVKVEIKNSSPE